MTETVGGHERNRRVSDRQVEWVRGTRRELITSLADTLSSLDDPLREAGASVLFGKIAIDPEDLDRGIYKALNDEDRHFFIHSEDLQLLGSVASMAAAGVALLRDPIGSIGGLLILLYRFRRNRVKISGEQAAVLATLRESPTEGWTAQELGEQLSGSLSSSAVEEVLEQLRTLRKDNGTLTELVTEVEGRWRVCDP